MSWTHCQSQYDAMYELAVFMKEVKQLETAMCSHEVKKYQNVYDEGKKQRMILRRIILVYTDYDTPIRAGKRGVYCGRM